MVRGCEVAAPPSTANDTDPIGVAVLAPLADTVAVKLSGWPKSGFVGPASVVVVPACETVSVSEPELAW